MTKSLFSLFLGLFLVLGPVGGARAAMVHPAAPVHLVTAPVIAVADAALGGMNEVFKMEPPHLLFLGGGILSGLLLISPGLGIGDLFGVALGVIGSEFLYRTTYNRSRWF